MRNTLSICLSVLFVSLLAASAHGVTIIDLPEFSSTDTNPKTDATGNTWGLYSYDEHPEPWSSTVIAGDFSKYEAMTWWPYASRWDGLGSTSYVGNTLAAICDNTYDYAAALSFTAGQAGTYSIQGNAVLEDVTSTWNYANMKIGKFDSLGNYTLLHNESVENAGTINLAAITGLQDMVLAADDKLVFSAHAQEGGYRITTLDLSGVTIEYVPEPASVALMLMGLGGLIRRRR